MVGLIDVLDAFVFRLLSLLDVLLLLFLLLEKRNIVISFLKSKKTSIPMSSCDVLGASISKIIYT